MSATEPRAAGTPVPPPPTLPPSPLPPRSPVPPPTEIGGSASLGDADPPTSPARPGNGARVPSPPSPLTSDPPLPAAYPGARPLRNPGVNPSPSPYAGLVTRLLALAIDAAVINVVAWMTALIAGLALSVFSLPEEVNAMIAAFGALCALVWTAGYFSFFWATTGQTPGDRLLCVRVVQAENGKPPRPRRAVLRFFLLPLSVIPFGLGVGLILVDDRRRALHDVLAGTVVVDSADDDDIPRRRRTAGPVS